MSDPRGAHTTRPAEHADDTIRTEREPDADLAGMVLDGRYVLERVLASGGMGSVYLAEHVALRAPVAVKVIHPDLRAARHAQRFRIEARAAMLLQHRNVVRVMDYGEAASGLLYIVMERLSGESLGAKLDRIGTLPIAEIGRLLNDVLLALEAAHGVGIVHRDLKPDNVFLAEEPGGEIVVKLVDFGLARVDDRGLSERVTHATDVAGTPSFMSPEQCRSLDVGAPTDLYAVGCMLTQMLQGAPPFDGATTMDIFTKQMFRAPPALDRADGAEEVPWLLEELRMHLLAKAPEQRPDAATARVALATALNAELSAKVRPDRSRALATSRQQRVPTWGSPAPRGLRARGSGRVRLVQLNTASGQVEDVGARVAGDLDVAITSLGYTCVDEAAEVIVLSSPRGYGDAERWLRAHREEGVPVIVCVPASSDAALPALIAAGAAECCPGPPSAAVLEPRLARVFRRRR